LSATRERAALLAVTSSDLNTDRSRVQPAVPLTSPTKTADRRLAVNHTCPFNRPVISTETSRCCRPLSTYVSVSSFGSSKKIYRTTLCNSESNDTDVTYAQTVEQSYNCSAVNLEGHGKVMLTYTFAIHLFSYERRYNNGLWDAVAIACQRCRVGRAEYIRLPTSSRGTGCWRDDFDAVPDRRCSSSRLYRLSTLSRETSQFRPSADAIARERTLTTRPSHRAGVLVIRDRAESLNFAAACLLCWLF